MELEESAVTENSEGGSEGDQGSGSEAELKFKFGEKEYPRTDVEKYIQAYENDTAWQKRNTEKAMSLAEQERRIEKARKLEEYLNAHPEKYAEVEKVFKAQAANGPTALPPEVMEQVERMQKLETDLMAQNASIQLKSDMADLKERYGEYFKDTPGLEKEVIDMALKKDIMDLETVLRYVLFDKVKESGIRQGQQKLKGALKTSQSLGMPKGSKGVSGDLRKEILGTKSTGQAITKYLDAMDGGE